MDKTVYAFFEFYEYAEVGEVTHFCSVFRTNRIFLFDVAPWVIFELLDAKRHLAFVAVESKDNSFNFVANFQEFLS